MPPLKSQELKTATANHEESQAALVALEDPEEGASITADGAVETARAQAQKTAKLVEECKAQRAERKRWQLESEIAAIDRYVHALDVPLGGAGSSGPGTEALSSAGLVALAAARRQAEAAAAEAAAAGGM